MDVIEIRDANLNKKEILDQVRQGIKGKMVPDFAAIGPEKLRQVQADLADESGAAPDNHESFIDLMLIHQLEEPEFSSEAPIIGPWIVRFRQLWNWMSTKWYVRPILKQQSTVNGQIALLLIEMEAIVNDNQQTINRLQERVSQLESLVTQNKRHEE
jgi:hypothetical protein